MNKQQKERYFDAARQIDPADLPAKLRGHFIYIKSATEDHTTWEYYEADASIKEFVDEHAALILQHIADKAKPESKPTEGKGGNGKAERGSGTKGKAAEKKTPDLKLVKDIDIELRLIARFIGLHEKPKTYKQVLDLLKAVQAAIQKGHVRKSQSPTPYHKEVGWMQGVLVRALNLSYSGEDLNEVKTLSMDAKEIDKLKAIQRSFDVLPSVRLGLRFLQLEGKKPTDAQAAGLMLRIRKAELAGMIPEGDPNAAFIKKIMAALSDYGHRKTSTVRVSEATLNGFVGTVLGCACQEARMPKGSPGKSTAGNLGFIIPPPKGNAVEVRSDDLHTLKDDGLRFTGRWRELFNSPTKGFSALVYGRPKSGKSTLAIDFAGYLARNFGRVLYASIEEGARGTVAERINRLGAGHADLLVSNHLPADLSGYRFVFIDSVSRGRMDIDQLRDLIRDWPDVGFVFIFHVTKDGMPRGSAEFQHEVDVIVEVKDGYAEAVGRFGPGGTEVRFG